MTFIGIRRHRALLPIIGGNVIATPIGAPRRALFVALLQRPNAFSVVCRRANARKVRLEVITSDAFANEVVVVLARFVTPHAFFGRVGTNASPTIRDRNFAIDARELAVVVAMLHKRFMRARIAHRHFARLRRFCIDAPPIADAHFGLCAMASHAFVLDTRLGGIGARESLRALSRNGRLACPLVANPIVWARARHRTRRFGHAFILVTTIPLATIDIAMTNDLFARHALRILAKQPIGTRVDRRAFARKTSAIFSTNRSRGARSLRASIFGAEYTSPIDTRPIILLARAIVVAFGLAFSRYANFPTRARFCRRTFIDAFAIFANLIVGTWLLGRTFCFDFCNALAAFANFTIRARLRGGTFCLTNPRRQAYFALATRKDRARLGARVIDAQIRPTFAPRLARSTVVFLRFGRFTASVDQE